MAGVVSFVASAADPETRSFAVEVLVENPDLLRAAGGTATLNIRLPEQKAQFISPAYLTLDDDGRPGVKYVNGQDRVMFQTVKLLNVATDGADRKSTRLNSSHVRISYAVFCLKKKNP